MYTLLVHFSYRIHSSIHTSNQPSCVLCVVECMHDLVKSSFSPIVGWGVHPSSLMASSTIHSGIHNTNTAAIHKLSWLSALHCQKLTLFLVCFCSQHAKWTAMRQSFPSHFLFHFISSQKLYFLYYFLWKKVSKIFATKYTLKNRERKNILYTKVSWIEHKGTGVSKVQRERLGPFFLVILNKKYEYHLTREFPSLTKNLRKWKK